MPFELTLTFTDEQLRTLRAAGDKVALGFGQEKGGRPNLAWLAFLPEPRIVVSWQDEGLYCSAHERTHLSRLVPLALSPPPVLPGGEYVVAPDGRFSAPHETTFIKANVYLRASWPQHGRNHHLTVGFCREATVNGVPTGLLPTTCDSLFNYGTCLLARTPRTPRTLYIWVDPEAESSLIDNRYLQLSKVSISAETPAAQLRYSEHGRSFWPS